MPALGIGLLATVKGLGRCQTEVLTAVRGEYARVGHRVVGTDVVAALKQAGPRWSRTSVAGALSVSVQTNLLANHRAGGGEEHSGDAPVEGYRRVWANGRKRPEKPR